MRIEVKENDVIMIKGERKPLKIRKILEEDVQIGEDKITLKRLFFYEKHQPEFDWRVTKVLGDENE